MSYNRRGKKNKNIKHIETLPIISESSESSEDTQDSEEFQEPEPEPELLGRTRRNKVVNQADFVTPKIYNVSNPSEVYTLAIDVGVRNLGYAIYNGNIVKFDLFDIVETMKTYKFPKNTDLPSKRAKVIVDWFKDLINKYNIVELVVEQQVNKNIVCLCIQNFLIALAAEHSVHFKIYNPKNKFQYIPVEFISNKKEHKKISVHYALNIIYNLGLSINHFKEFPKKDDISDAICMAVMSRETSADTIRYLIRDHTNNPLLSELTKPIKFNKLNL